MSILCLYPFLFLVLAMLLFFGAGHVTAQEETQAGRVQKSGAEPAATFVAHVDEVELPFIVTDKHHRWINDLSENEVLLRDNGRPPESIRVFQNQTGLPLRLGLIVDTSDSITEQFEFERKAAALFISQVVDSAKDLAFVLGFSNAPVLIQDFTADTEALATAVEELQLGGTTALYDTISFACKKLQGTENRFTGRMLIVLTDGMDNSSHLQPKQLIEDVLRCNAMVIVLHTALEPDTSSSSYKVLEKLTKETGGQILPAADKREIAKAFSELRSQLRNYYLLAYRPAQFERNGSYRKIQLKTTRRGTHVICRRGYYAMTDEQESAEGLSFHSSH